MPSAAYTQHFDYAFDYRTLSYHTDAISSYATFGRTFDLFGDGSVRLASTPGHSAGHQSLICRLRDRDLRLGEGEFTIIPRGVEHMPVAEEAAHILLLEPKTTLNTGNVQGERTVADLERV